MSKNNFESKEYEYVKKNIFLNKKWIWYNPNQLFVENIWMFASAPPW